jgi:beta-lactamase regulating signal transducer with metallopeptidase domain
MVSTDVLAVASALLAWFAKVGIACLFIWGTCSLLGSPRLKSAVWNVFIIAVAFSFIFAFLLAPTAPTHIRGVAIQAETPVVATSTQPATDPAPYLGWSFGINSQWSSRLQAVAGNLGYLYIAIVCCLFSRWIWQGLRLSSLLRSGQNASADLNLLFATLCDELGIGSCRLLTVPNLHSPATARWRRPCVLIPSELASQVGPSQLLDMLRHELVHVRRRDYLWDRIATLTCSFVFLHPAVWFAYRQLRRQRELACDYEVAGQERDSRLRYAESLLSLARWRRGHDHPTAALGFAAVSSPLGTRIHALLAPPTSTLKGNSVLSGGLIVTACCALLSILPASGISLYWAVEHHWVNTTPSEIQAVIPVVPAATPKKLQHERTESKLRVLTATLSPSSVPSPTEEAVANMPLASAPLPGPAQPSLASEENAPKRNWPKVSELAPVATRPPKRDWTTPRFSDTKPKAGMTGIRKTMFSAAVFGLTYVVHETGEPD